MNIAPVSFDLSTVFSTVAAAVPEQVFVVWRDRRLTYGDIDARIDGFAHYLASSGLGLNIERDVLAGHESGQDHLAVYLRNGNEYLEATIGGYRARVASFNCSYRYVEQELYYLLSDSRAQAIVYNAEFAPRLAAVRDKLPDLRVLIQVADASDNDLLPGAVDYESVVCTPATNAAMPAPSGDDLYLLYTGGTTGMPKGVLWRQHDIFVSSMGGRPFGSDQPLVSYDELATQARNLAGSTSMLLIAPLMHGAAQWAVFNVITMGGTIVIPDRVDHLHASEVLRLVERERVTAIPMVGDAVARPLIDEIEVGHYDLSSVISMSNGGAALSSGVRERILAAIPHALILDSVGASEAGMQMTTMTNVGSDTEIALFTPQSDTAVVAEDFSRVLEPGDGGQGWLARRGLIPLGYLGDEVKTARTFPTIDGVRWSVPGDRAIMLPDGRIELLGRDSITINSGGEKIFAEEVERAIAAHPGVFDVVVVGRPSQRWGHEVVAIVQIADGASVSNDELIDVCNQSIARYKVPKEFIRSDKIQRSPAGKADYRWAKALIATDA